MRISVRAPRRSLPLPAVIAYLKRLVSSLAAYQLADIVSKLIAVLLLPVYTRYIHPAGYGVVELLANGVILISILVRFGMIEAFLRFYFTDEDHERRDALVRRTAGFLLVATTVVAVVLPLFAGPLSQVVLSHRDPAIFRIAVLGLWSFTNLELAYALLRVDERLRLYAIASLTNVLLTIAASVVLVVVARRRPARAAAGQLRASTTLVLLALWFKLRHRLRPAPRPRRSGWRSCCASGCRPCRPRRRSTCSASSTATTSSTTAARGSAGLYSIAIKLAGRGRVHRAGVSVRVAAAGLLGHRRRRGRAAVRPGHDLLPAVSGWVVAALAARAAGSCSC